MIGHMPLEQPAALTHPGFMYSAWLLMLGLMTFNQFTKLTQLEIVYFALHNVSSVGCMVGVYWFCNLIGTYAFTSF
jgi:hypothetical protein